ncbi:MAG: VCBS repeat-containing protein, partial [Kofleriaceae bacterium]
MQEGPMIVRASRHTIALIIASGAAVAACGEEEAFEPQVASNERLLAAAATAQLGKDDQSIEQMTVVGDLDGDGIDDAVIRTSYAIDPAGELQFGGDIYVIYGGSGLTGNIDLSNVPRLTGAYGFGVGITATAVGDVDGDGLADLLVTASRSLRCADNIDGAGDDLRTGAYLMYGSPTRVAGAVPIGGVATFLRDTHPCSIVSAVAGLGDLDGDGKADFAVARLGIHTGEPTETLVFYGRGARFPAVVELVASADASITDGLPVTTVLSGIAKLGDVDGDGYDDFAVRDPIAFNTNVRLIRGGATRLAGNVAAAALSQTLFLGEDLCFHNEHFVAPLGDLDGDGADDFALVGCQGDDARVPQRSVDRVFYGRLGGFPAQVRFDESDATLALAGAGA